MSFNKRWLFSVPLVLGVLCTVGAVQAQDTDENSSLVAEDLLLDEVLTGELAPKEPMDISTDTVAESADEAASDDAIVLQDDLFLPAGEPATDNVDESVEDLAADVLGEEPALETAEMPVVVEPVDEALVLEEPVVEEAAPEPVDLSTDFDLSVKEEKGVPLPGVEEIAEEALGSEETDPMTSDPETPANPPQDDLLADLGIEEPAEETPAAPSAAAPAASESSRDDDLLMDLGLEEPASPTPTQEQPVMEEPIAEALVEEAPAVSESSGDNDLLMDLGLEEPTSPTPAQEQPVMEEPIAEAPAEDAPAAAESSGDNDLLMDLGLEEPTSPTPAQKQPVMEEPIAEEPVVQEDEPMDSAVTEDVPAPFPTETMMDQPVAERNPEPVVPPQPEEEPSAQQMPQKEIVPPSVEVMMESEALKRKAYRNHAMATIELGHQALNERRYQRARTYFENAMETLDRLGRRTEDRRIRQKAREGLAETFYRWALVFRDQEDLEAAGQMAVNASTYGHPKAPRLVGEIEQAKVSPPPPPAPADIARWKQKEFKDAEEDIASKLKEGRQYYMTGEYRNAENLFKSILDADPFNTEAIRMLEKTNRKMRQIATMELEATRQDMLRELRQAWNPRDYGLEQQDRMEMTGPDSPKADDKNQSQRVRILKKMDSIIVPEIEFRQANINDVVHFLQSASQEYDATDSDDAKQGVNIILNLQSSQSEAPSAPAMDDPFAVPSSESSPQVGGVPLITFSARQISLLEALKIVTKVANLKYRIEGSVVMILPWDAPTGEIIVRTYDVLPSVEERISTVDAQLSQGGGGFGAARSMGSGGGFGALDTGSASSEAVNWKSAFEEMGVPWPQGSSIKYVRAMGKLVVANTADNLTIFEQILAELNVTPIQIEIEARFVEVNQTDLDSLGVEWLLNDNWEVAQQTGQQNVPLSARQRIVVAENAANGGFTVGNRFLQGGAGLAGTTVADNLMTIAGVLTNPELSVVLHALQQRGSTDLLSAPKVLTQSGVEATIKVVTEYVYPTDFEVTPITAASQGGAGDSQIVGGVVEPSGFEVREVGVILTVTPEVSPEGQMIDLTMRPEVVSDPVWKNYGTTYTDSNGNTQQLAMEQPFFFTRSISSTISIYDNATVVMGGMITENRTTVNDRIPFLGDIPLIGRLFRSSYEQSEKRNLLIFVTARLVDPAGRPIKGSGSSAAAKL